MPALAPVDRPPLLLVTALDCPATDGEAPGVLVVVPTSTTVVAGADAITTLVTVVYPATPLDVVCRTCVIVAVLVE